MIDFWIGVLTVPAGALAAAIVWGAILFMFDAYGRWNGELWFRRTSTRDDQLDWSHIAASMMHSKRLYRFRLIPGWAMVLQRYRYVDHLDLDQVHRTRRAIDASIKADD